MKNIIIISILSCFFALAGCSDDPEDTKAAPAARVTGVDVGNFSIDNVQLGTSLKPSDGQPELVTKDDLLRPGIELNTDGEGLLEIFVDFGEYRGDFFKSGKPVKLTSKTSPADVVQILGEPYWRDISEGELMLIYEYDSGSREIIFEFPDSKTLRYINITMSPLFADSQQRERYGVDKQWPPEN